MYEIKIQNLDNLLDRLNKNIGDICVDYEMQNLLFIVSKSEVLTNDGAEIEKLSNYNLIKTLLQLIKENNRFNVEKIVILFHNIDHLLTSNEYEKIINAKNDEIEELREYEILLKNEL